MNYLQNRLAAKKQANEESGFTLIELLVVIVILGILAAVVVFSVRGITNRGQSSACRATASALTTAEEAYYAKEGSYATTGAVILVSDGYLNANGLTVAAATVSAPGANGWSTTRTAATATAGPIWAGCPT
jgi:prepilin-type N-terminal cleavage/methylation domain-containing protein